MRPFLTIAVAVIGTFAAHVAHAQSCDLYVAALSALSADSANTILIDHTVMGVPTFAFNGYLTARRGDTALARMAGPPLRELNAKRVPVPSCLTIERGWSVVPDSVLFALFGPKGGRWPAFQERFPKAKHFALLSQPLIHGDTADIFVGTASGPLSGRGIIVRLVRASDGKWAKQSEVQLWVS